MAAMVSTAEQIQTGRPAQAGDIADRAAGLTILLDSGVEITHEVAGERLRGACDGVGALLRFRLHP